MKRALLIGGGAVILVLLVLMAVVTLWADPDRFRPRLESAMSDVLGRKVTVGKIRIAWLSMGVAIDDLAIADDPAFSAKPFVTAKSAVAGVSLLPLIRSRTIQVESFRLESPRVTLLRGTSGVWNFSKLGSTAGAGGSDRSGSASAIGVLVQKITIAGGQVIVGGPALGGKERLYDALDIDISSLSLNSRFPFRLTASTPGGGALRLEGEAGPANLQDVSATPFEATAEITHLDLASTGFTDPSAGFAGLVDFAGSLRSTDARINAKGKLTGSKLQLVPGGAPSGVPMELDYETNYNPKTQTGTVKQGDVHIGKAVARLTGEYELAGASPSVRMTLVGQALAASELQAALPAVGFRLPSGASLKQGTLNTQMAITGPLDRLVITGPIALSNATLAGYDLSGKMGALGAFAGLPKSSDTQIERLGSGVRVSPEGIRVDDLVLIVPAIGTLTGRGTVAPSGALDFTMLAKLTGVAGAAGGLARVATFGQQGEGVPFRIQGTTSNPSFLPDARAIAGNIVKGSVSTTKAAGLDKASKAIGGLLGKKK